MPRLLHGGWALTSNAFSRMFRLREVSVKKDPYLARLKRCSDLEIPSLPDLVKQQDREIIRQLIGRMAKISQPGEGANLVLMVLAVTARYATWLPDKLSVRCKRDGAHTKIDIQCGSGAFYERLWPIITFRAPIEEFRLLAQKLCVRRASPFDLGDEDANTDDSIHLVMREEVAAMRPSMMPATDSARDRLVKMLQTVRKSTVPPPAPDSTPIVSKKFDTTEVDAGWEE